MPVFYFIVVTIFFSLVPEPNPDAAFETGVLEGKGEKKTKLTIPIGKKTLSQGGAVDLVKKWQGRGVIEADTGNVLATMLQDNVSLFLSQEVGAEYRSEAKQSADP